jgi:hypothetical protein
MYTLNFDFPLVWRTPTSLQFGIDRVAATLHEVTPTQERVLALLQSRVSAATLRAVAAEHGMAWGEVEEFLASLGEALWDSTRDKPAAAGLLASEQRLRIAIDGRGNCAEATAKLLASQGHQVSFASGAVAGRTDVALIFGSFVLEPHRAGDWLRRETPALPIIFGSAQVMIGPILGPQLCAWCLELHRRDADPAWPAIATQVMGHPSRLETPLIAAELSAMLARWVVGSNEPSANVAIQLDAHTGGRVSVRFSPHPECACLSPTQNVNVLAVSDDR